MESKTIKYKRKQKKYLFVPAKHQLQFSCDWAVYPINKGTSVCYTTDKLRARLISISLNRFLNSKEGEKWFERNAKNR